MTDSPHRPEPTSAVDADGIVADAVPGNWVDAYAPAWSRPYLRLSRADRPAGTWLLFIPCIWGVLLAAASLDRLALSDLWVLIGCGLGAFLMRGAGCTWNDITDRDFDAQVTRTRSRPLPSGQVTARQAAIWMIVQALVAFAILLTFPSAAIWLGIAALLPVCIYPFAKRFTWWPQLFLGIAFNWGALLGWTAVTGSLNLSALALYAAGIAWTIYYDTIYAHQDIEDDALIGVKSTARLFGENSPSWLHVFRHLATGLLMIAGALALPFGAALIAVFAGAAGFYLHTSRQMRKLDIDNPKICWSLFRANRDTGLIFAAFLLPALVL